MSWLVGAFARFLPGLGPAVGALLNPWVLLAAGAVVVGAFLYGLHIGHERLEAFELKVAAVGFAQEQRTAERIRRGKILKEKIDAEHDRDMAHLSGRIAALVQRLSVDPGGSVLPAAGPGADDAETIAFDRAELDAALRRFTAGAAALAGEGEAAVIGLDTARRWNADRERAAD